MSKMAIPQTLAWDEAKIRATAHLVEHRARGYTEYQCAGLLFNQHQNVPEGDFNRFLHEIGVDVDF